MFKNFITKSNFLTMEDIRDKKLGKLDFGDTISSAISKVDVGFKVSRYFELEEKVKELKAEYLIKNKKHYSFKVRTIKAEPVIEELFTKNQLKSNDSIAKKMRKMTNLEKAYTKLDLFVSENLANMELDYYELKIALAKETSN